MPHGGPADPVARSEWARQRRRAAALHHPDRGGDVEAYLAALAAVDTAFGVGRAPGPAGPEITVRRTWRGTPMRLAHRRRRLVRTVRSRLPRRLRGSRHTTEI